MKLFATRVWGFDPEIWPVVGFGSDGICANLIRKPSSGERFRIDPAKIDGLWAGCL